MNSFIVGLALLLLLLAFRWGMAHWQRGRFATQLKRGADALQSGDTAEAESAFRACVRLAPTSAPIRLALGSVLARGHKFRDAEEQLRMAAQLEPRQPRGHLELGFFLALCAPDRPDDAVAAFDEAIRYAPELRAGLAKDPRLTALRQYPSFRELLNN